VSGDAAAAPADETGLWRLASALASATTAADVSGIVAERGGPAAGAAFANMAVLGETGSRLRAVHAPSLDPGLTTRWSDFDVDASTPLGAAVLSGAPVLLGDLPAIAAAYPDLVDDTLAASLQATASFPLHSSGGGTLGAMGLGWSDPQAFGERQRSRLALVAGITAQALERVMTSTAATVSADERAQAQLLQETFLPAVLGGREGVDFAAAYLPASDAPLGGDWYDAFGVGGRTCMVIGDVAGHGAASAALMVQLRTAIRAFADEDPDPGRVLTRLNRMLGRLEPDGTATAVVAIWDPATRNLAAAGAGHVPPLWRRAGTVDYLDTGAGVLLGALPDSVYHSVVTAVEAPATALFYTDGLVEFRTVSLDDGMDSLRRHLVGLPDASLGILRDEVLHWRLASGQREDDLCVLVAEFT
jgi:serine phosphatase RsbU (regulator of sigma subunit)